MLERVPPYLERLEDHALHTAYLGQFVQTWQYHPFPDPEILEKNTVQHFRAARDALGEAHFICKLGAYWRQHDNDLAKALRYYETAMHLAQEANDVKTQCLAMREAAECIWQLGDYCEAKLKEARALLAFCGLQGSSLDLMLINSNAEVHLQKTEYAEARALYSRTSPAQAPLAHAYDRLNIVYIDNETGIDTSKVRQDLQVIKASLESIMNPPGITICEVFQAYADIRDGLLKNAR
ncbi:hypothetical protein B0H19DRAFT_1069244 [Mycena capillaripes]|nr:hypothetical protein B0H19DRAFT_1069244 [Mycena capillaripes]